MEKMSRNQLHCSYAPDQSFLYVKIRRATDNEIGVSISIGAQTARNAPAGGWSLGEGIRVNCHAPLASKLTQPPGAISFGLKRLQIVIGKYGTSW